MLLDGGTFDASPGDAAADASPDAAGDAASPDAASPDGGPSIPDASMRMDAGFDAFVDTGTDASDPRPLPDFGATYWTIATDLPRTVRLRHPFEVLVASEDIEFFTAFQLDSFSLYLEQVDGERIILSFPADAIERNCHSWIADQGLFAGDYDAVVSNFNDFDGRDFFSAALRSRPTIPGATFVEEVVESGLNNGIASGSATLSRFTVRPGHRYIFRGVRGLASAYLITGAEADRFEAEGRFTPFREWTGEDERFGPVPVELELAAGEYGLVVANPGERSVCYAMRISEWAE